MSDYTIRMAACIAPGNLITFENPPWGYAEQTLRNHFEHSGLIRLKVEGPGRRLLDTLEFESEPYRYLLWAGLHEHLPGGALKWHQVKKVAPARRPCFDQRTWDLRWMQTDLTLALGAFKEVFETGSLCTETLANIRWSARASGQSTRTQSA